MKNTFNYLRTLPRYYTIPAALIIVVICITSYLHLTGSKVAPIDASAGISHVHIESVASLSSQSGPLPVTGKVTSLNEATILAQTAGGIVSLSHKLGDKVSAGGVIAQFENSSQRAAVLQAQGAYDAAQANLDKVINGTRSEQVDISQTTAAKAQAALSETVSSTIDTIRGIYSTNDDIVHAKIDAVFSNPRSANVQFIMYTSNQSLVNKVVQERQSLEVLLNAESDRSLALNTSSNLSAELALASADTRQLKSFVDDVAAALNISISSQSVPQSTISGYIATASAARSSLSGSLSALSSAAQTLTAATAQAQVSSTQLQQDASGSRPEDDAAARASLKQAQGALDGARANLEKTIVRSPISGTIVSLPVTLGDFVSNFAPIADISNPQALQIKAYVTADDAKTIAVGGVVMIEGSVKGVVTSIAPAIDPSTNKIEVAIGVTGDQSALTDGETVTLNIDRVNSKTATQGKPSTAITIPIVSAKITPAGALVFTVASSTLTAHPIELGAILGDQVTVRSGLTADMTIVADARGLSDGQTVIVDTQ
jgi:HlyD family secretion protein